VGCKPNLQISRKKIKIEVIPSKNSLPKQDYKSLLDTEIKQIVIFNPTRLKLGNTRCEALVGKNTFEKTGKDAFYSISIVYENDYILFSRDIPFSKISKDKLSADISKIVDFDPKKRLVRFDLGIYKTEFTIPLQQELIEGRKLLDNWKANTDIPPPPDSSVNCK
jgi:hypothetical protein